MKSVKWLRKDKNQECLVWEGRGVTQEGTGAHVSSSNNLTYNQEAFFCARGAEWPLCHCSVIGNTDRIQLGHRYPRGTVRNHSKEKSHSTGERKHTPTINS